MDPQSKFTLNVETEDTIHKEGMKNILSDIHLRSLAVGSPQSSLKWLEVQCSVAQFSPTFRPQDCYLSGFVHGIFLVQEHWSGWSFSLRGSFTRLNQNSYISCIVRVILK